MKITRNMKDEVYCVLFRVHQFRWGSGNVLFFCSYYPQASQLCCDTTPSKMKYSMHHSSQIFQLFFPDLSFVELIFFSPPHLYKCTWWWWSFSISEWIILDPYTIHQKTHKTCFTTWRHCLSCSQRSSTMWLETFQRVEFSTSQWRFTIARSWKSR